MDAESSPRQRSKTSIRNILAANLALTIPPRFHSLKCDFDFLHDAPFAVKIRENQVSRQIAIGFRALIIRLVLKKGLGSLLRITREQSLSLGGQFLFQRVVSASNRLWTRSHF
jgi:hypothetical protein